jgi:hypothetical protein
MSWDLDHAGTIVPGQLKKSQAIEQSASGSRETITGDVEQ